MEDRWIVDRRNGGERGGRADLYDSNDEGGAPQGSPHAVSKSQITFTEI